jgi:hypothetical protein
MSTLQMQRALILRGRTNAERLIQLNEENKFAFEYYLLYIDLKIVVYISNANVGRRHASADHGSKIYTDVSPNKRIMGDF